MCVSGGSITQKELRGYSWLTRFNKRKPQTHYKTETLEEWFVLGWPDYASSITVQGVTYTEAEFNKLKSEWEDRNNIWKIDESELVF